MPVQYVIFLAQYAAVYRTGEDGIVHYAKLHLYNLRDTAR